MSLLLNDSLLISTAKLGYNRNKIGNIREIIGNIREFRHFLLYLRQITRNKEIMRKILLSLMIISLKAIITYADSNLIDRATPIDINAFDSDESGELMIDSKGLMWIASSAGLIAYDGYKFKTYKSDAYTPGILPNNVIVSITEDKDNNIWIGTRDGLAKMNRRTGQFKTYHLKQNNQRIIWTLFTSADGTVWIGTDGGLTRYDKESDSFYTYGMERGYSVKAITEDKRGYLYIGTWRNGLMRLHPDRKTFDHYPRLNYMNSAYSLLLDSKQRLWIGTWTYGIAMIENPENTDNPTIHYYNNTGKDFSIVYKIVEDPVTSTIWACSRSGISIYDNRHPEKGFTNDPRYPFCVDIVTDKQGHMYIGTVDYGILKINTNPNVLTFIDIFKANPKPTINDIKALYSDDGSIFWMGMRPCGIARYDTKTNSVEYNDNITELKGWNLTDEFCSALTSSIIKDVKGNLWFANSSYGIMVINNGTPTIINKLNTPYIIDDYVNTLMKDHHGNIWIGQREGLSIHLYDPNDNLHQRGVVVGMKEDNRDFSNCDVRGIMETRKGVVWIATENEGIIRVEGNPNNPKKMMFKQYKAALGNMPIDDASECIEDTQGRIWATSSGGTLMLYDATNDRFKAVNRDYQMNTNRLFAIADGPFSSLWLFTDKAIIKMTIDKDNRAYFKSYSDSERNKFRPTGPSDAIRIGNNIYFGNKNGLLKLNPQELMGNKSTPINLIVTDILINDKPISDFDTLFVREITKQSPSYTKELTIPASVNKFSIEFALLNYFNQEQNYYAYKLEGYDNNWHYTVNDHRATFENLPSGTYKLKLRAADSNGNMTQLPYDITIHILPPWYLTWWAWMLYLLILMAIVSAGLLRYKEHLKTRNKLQMEVVFTNITHELLTPLTVISAVIDDMRRKEPRFIGEYNLITNNIAKISRLLRQILEVRKSQAGQLKLKVSQGDLGELADIIISNIKPMGAPKNIAISLECNNMDMLANAWFDPDKIDKILNNLVSNSIKYGREGGMVKITIKAIDNRARITVEDNGIGMSKQQLKKLYTRFLDGDYRKMGTAGTGIGLSLTRDLVNLHHGSISCQSKEDMGTTFTIEIPIMRKDYRDDEVDDSNVGFNIQKMPTKQEMLIDTVSGLSLTPQKDNEHVYSILLVEDNAELLSLMQRLLNRKYNVFTAQNGKQGLNIIYKEHLDLVVSDVMMPVMDGLEMTKIIKEDNRYAQLPVVLLTAKTKEEDLNDALAMGADEYIFKPFNLSQLEMRIDNIIANRYRIRRKFSMEDHLPMDIIEHVSNPEKAFLERVTELIILNIEDGEYGRERLAADMFISSSTLFNKVKQYTGQSLTTYINGVKLKEARKILEFYPTISVNELSAKVGFNTPNYFNKCFHKEYGMTVKEFAAKLRATQ